MTQPSTIAVLGGGYAGLFAAQRAARAAARARGSAVRVVLIDADDAWQERTRWHQIAAGETVRSRPRAGYSGEPAWRTSPQRPRA